jgi:hypothetical protein
MLSTQAIILLVCNLIVLIAVGLSLFALKKNVDKGESKTVVLLQNIAVMIMFVVIMMMQVYSINCMVFGDCQLWTWIIVGLAVIGTLTFLGFFTYVAIATKLTERAVVDAVTLPAKTTSKVAKVETSSKVTIKDASA